MSDWQNYLDLSHGTPFRFSICGDESCLTEDGVPILRPGADRAITQHPECATDFLRRLASGGLELRSQQRIARLLVDLRERCHDDAGTDWTAVRPHLKNALLALSAHALEMMSAQGATVDLTDDDLSEYDAFGPEACIRHGLSVARTLAQAAFLKALADKLLKEPRPSDLCGEWKLVITAPQDPGYARAFAGLYGGAAHARIKAVPRAKHWELVFLNFPPLFNWFGLEQAAYEAAAPAVAKTLVASVSAFGQLSD